MCGVVGYLDLRGNRPPNEETLRRMADTLVHRGPDSCGYATHGPAGFGFRRLSIIDLSGGDQPMRNEDGSVILVCNGEIFNYRELRAELLRRGHRFRTECDVEVLVHLYEDEGMDFLNRLNGQFAFALYDTRSRQLCLARDQVGILPMYYTVADDVLIFASEIKALLRHPLVRREVNLSGLDQLLSFPGLVSPMTMFKQISSLPSGHMLIAQDGRIQLKEYWDLDYPLLGECSYDQPESYYVEQLHDLLMRAVRYRLQADVPVGFYLSGGLDSSLIAAAIHQITPDAQRHSFSIGFTEAQMSETRYQQMMAAHVNSIHHEIIFNWDEIETRLRTMMHHCECPVKETYNTCSLALAQAARNAGIPVILTGEGADELFAGYVGYRFDGLGVRKSATNDLDALLEDELREQLWGDKDLFYEQDFHAFREVKAALYSPALNARYPEFDCLQFPVVNRERLRGRHVLHQRSYLDFKLRLADHLIGDHGDRMAMAHSVEARYPFLDRDLIDFARVIPPDLKLKQLNEKYIVKQVAASLVPSAIINREKFGFHAPGSSYLLQRKIGWIDDLLSYEQIKRQGYFNPDFVEHLKRRYMQPGFKLNLPFETDLLAIVLTFNIFLDLFELPAL